MALSCDSTPTQPLSGAAAVASLQVSPTILVLDDGQTGTITSTLRDQGGQLVTTLPKGKAVQWSSSSPGIATVSSNGVVEAKHVGEATVRAWIDQAEAVARVVVRPVPDNIRFNVLNRIHEGVVATPLLDSAQVRVVDRGGLPVPNVSVRFIVETGGGSVSPSTVVTDGDGYARAVWVLGTAAGDQELKATMVLPQASAPGAQGSPPNGVELAPTAKIRARAFASEPASVEVVPAIDTLVVDDSNRLHTAVRDKWGNQIKDAAISWSSTSADLVTVDDDGVVRGHHEGTATITAVVAAGGGAPGAQETTASASSPAGSGKVHVKARGDLSLVRVSGSGQSGMVGQQLASPLRVRVIDKDGNGVPGVDISWTASAGSPSASATMTDSQGYTQIAWTLGTAARDYEMTADADGMNATSFASTATAGPVASVLVGPASVELTAGSSLQFAVSLADKYGNPASSPVTWSSTNTAVATVDVGGFVTAQSAGSAHIKVASTGVTGSAEVTTTSRGGGSSGGGGGNGEGGGSGEPASISVSPAEDTINAIGGSRQLAATVRDASGSTLGSATVTWTSLNPGVATVDSNGKVVSKAVGVALIVAAAGTVADTATVHSAQLSTPVFLPAFPGAEGWGATALNECRSKPIQVLTVMNTNTSGPGSLAQAVRDVRSDRFTFIIFRTGGRILAPSGNNIRLSSGCVYVAGQTAPGDGIVIEGQGTAFWFRGGAPISDVVMRHMRFRGRNTRTTNNLIIAKGERIVLDHMSFTWSENYLLALLRYGGMSWSGPISDVTIQNSIVAEVFARHPTAFVIGTNDGLKETSAIDMTNVSIHRNLLAHNSHRNPMTAADNALVANNVIYNWQQGAGMMNQRGVVDWVNNYGKAGPMTQSAHTYMVNPYCNELGGSFSIYSAGNIGPRSSDAHGDNWTDPTRQVACYRGSGDYDGQEVPMQWRRNSQQSWGTVPFPVRLLSASDAYNAVLSDVGANARLTCDGRWTSALDVVDTRVISETQNAKGVSQPPTSESAVGGYPTYRKGAPCSDSDGDGLPDAWEQRFYGCATCVNRAAVGRDGYLVIEHYLNGTNP